MEKVTDENLYLVISEDLYLAKDMTLVVSASAHIEQNEQKNSASLPIIDIKPGLLILTEPLTEPAKKTLENLLKAINIDINTANISETWDAQFRFEKTLIFGFNDGAKNLNKMEQKGAHEIFHTYAIPVLNENKDLKLALWNELKVWFQL